MSIFGDWLGKVVAWGKKLTGGPSGGPSKPTKPVQPPPLPKGFGVPNADWLYSGSWLHTFSSNVEACRYLWEDEVLEIQYRGEDNSGEGYWYIYYDIPPELASGLSTTSSPGRWVWDHLRVRGTRYGHQKPYVRMRGFAGSPKKPGVGGKLPGGTQTTHNPSTVPQWAGNTPWSGKPWKP